VKNWESKSDLLMALGQTLESRHARGLRTVLVVDEAHGLSPHVLEEIRLLLNFETDTSKQLQIVLAGQPELRDVLNNPDLRQLKQRVALRCEISPLPDTAETERYIVSRLLVAGATRTSIFDAEAVDYIYRCSEGIPRQINNLCDNALLAGFAAGRKYINRDTVEEIAVTFDLLPRGEHARQLAADRAVSTAPILTASGHADLMTAQSAPSHEKAAVGEDSNLAYLRPTSYGR
jgi:general secretion pathway protein A